MAATLTVFTGPMFSGKSKRLVMALDHEAHGDKTILLLKPKIDDRTEGIAFRRGTLEAKNPKKEPGYEVFSAHIITSASEAEELFQKFKPQVIGIDEAQFLPIEVCDWIVQKLNDNQNPDLQIFIAGLDTDFMRRPFLVMPDLLAIADEVIKLKAKCDTCKGKHGAGILTQRISSSNKQIVIGNRNYQAACRVCHTIPE